MGLRFENQFRVAATMVANEFIDKYMIRANGEYVKVYLYLLRHQGELITFSSVADALDHTESDVRRAVSYWQKAGVLAAGAALDAEEKDRQSDPRGQSERRGQDEQREQPVQGRQDNRDGQDGQGEKERKNKIRAADIKFAGERPHCTAQELEKLLSDGEFSQLVYIAQKYLNKTFTPGDCEVFAYLYGTLRMPGELLEYLVEYCAQNGHTSLRYVEKVALSWYEKKLLTVEEAMAYSRSFSKDSFAVMKAFGLTGRNPGDNEYKLMERWFREYGFTKEIVVEACNRTMNAIHTPNFQYADTILREWKTSGVRTRGDIEELDRVRREKKAQDKSQDQKTGAGQKNGRKPANRFHNLEEHGYDYDEMVWSIINPEQNGG